MTVSPTRLISTYVDRSGCSRAVNNLLGLRTTWLTAIYNSVLLLLSHSAAFC